AADIVRKASIEQTHTYSLALSILFLDRLRDPGDVPLIESMTVRLMAGQNNVGGWTYHCPGLPDSEIHPLKTLTKPPNELVAGKPYPVYVLGDVYPVNPDPDKRRTAQQLPKEVRAQITNIYSPASVAAKGKNKHDDNSNTQFATLALWVG